MFSLLMSPLYKHFLLLPLLLYLLLSSPAYASPAVKHLRLPPGFQIEIFASGIKGARSLAYGQHGTIFVGTRDEGKVYALKDLNRDFVVDKIYTIASGLNYPNGVAFRNGSLYVAEIHRVIRFDDIESQLNNPPKPAVVNDTFPTDKHHGWKYIAFSPDNYLYIPIGMPCNVCLHDNPRYGSLMRMKSDGSELSIFARGIRNTVGFDWHPQTKELWFTDNGRDWLGDDAPPDELNKAPVPNLHFGFPYCHGRNILDPVFGKGKRCEDFQLPVQELGPHVAALGMRFYTGKMFPEKFRNQIFIAEHGSWNRTKPIGYRLSLVKLENSMPISYEVFAEGWHQGQKVTGRPVDLLILPDGSMLVSDDYAGAIYRITFQE